MAVDLTTAFGDFTNFNADENAPITVEGYIMGRRDQSRTPGLSKITPVKKAQVTKLNKPVEKVNTPEALKPNSRTPGLSTIEPVDSSSNKDGLTKISDSTDKQTDLIKSINEDNKMQTRTMAAASFFLDMQNANSAYRSVQNAAAINIMEARRQGYDAIERGRQRALEAQVEGSQAGEDSLLYLAAQGQDVSGAGAKKVQGSLEDVGLYNALTEQINSVREALGFELEEIGINYQLDLAKIDRDSTILSSGLSAAAKIGGTL